MSRQHVPAFFLPVVFLYIFYFSTITRVRISNTSDELAADISNAIRLDAMAIVSLRTQQLAGKSWYKQRQ